MKKLIFPLVVLLVLLGAKAVIGQDFKDQNLKHLVVGKTTLSEATALLDAPPLRSSVGASGATGYTWQYIQSNASLWTGNVRSSSKQVILVFNTDGTFQRIFQMDGIQLSPEDLERLFSRPAAEHAHKQQNQGNLRAIAD
ncbi:TPA: hypothetical protein UMZ03_001360 [Stenotrophomonas maltophilia]|jgi:hypothetical protein|uniref:hypothetical protein n=1 Tax=Stenotrophomonas maltophilia TaxID=40324 RepID=UPI0011D28203|nr:hypothetical protein [Stenotrophomonas maltophilia]MBH1464948.1 hypothetical protein [Stenotrophomonas maltophilia]MBH1614828.1 hypothetical protein [Stenotrophomonas maltophilia]MBN5168200.1 hypothetical protein [Stenotrophomonas maltophilia]MCU1041880.1 hypothetical protein [Stenotrophomonas maltophilia]HEL3850642.1 hypothetical protein [Stenotrophomonas maltophilia]